jgi:RTX calcium-binding nonapeptide repeat (4 copies)
MQREGGCAVVVRQGRLIAVVGTILIGCAVLLLAVGCAGTSSEAPQGKEQGHTEATKEQTRSPEATAPEQARCAETQPIERHGPSDRWITNDVPGCPKGGQLLGTDKADELAGLEGDDEIRALGAEDALIGGAGSDVIYGGPGNDDLIEPVKRVRDAGDDVFYGRGGDDHLAAGKGADVMYGGDGNDLLNSKDNDGPSDKLYCGKGKDRYTAGKNDYVDSSCEKRARLGWF